SSAPIKSEATRRRKMSGGASSSGLEGVEVARTRLSHVDGEAGVLVIAGLHVEALAERGGFEDACALLWDGAWPALGRPEEGRRARRAPRGALAATPRTSSARSPARTRRRRRPAGWTRTSPR